MTDSEKFENLKNRIDSLKVKKMAAESEMKRLTDDLDKIKNEILLTYKVDITDFAKAIESMKKDYANKMILLEEMVVDAEKKVEDIEK